MKRRTFFITLVSLLLLTWIKLWLFSALSIGIDANSPHDDFLFIKQATSILSGKWLGPYDNLTLAKGPGYSLFIAAMHILHIPLLTAEQLLYACACLVAAYLVCHMVKVDKHRIFLIAYGLLLFNPFSFDGNLNLRVNRPAIYYSLSVISLSSWGLAYLRSQKGSASRISIGWSILAGLTLSASWITREESVWLAIPACLFILGIVYCRYKEHHIWQGVITVLLAFGSFFMGLLPILVLNRIWYGTYIITEYQNASFIAAYSALTRVVPETFVPYLPVPKHTRLAIADVSPTFHLVDDQLEGYIADNWSAVTKHEAPLDHNVTDIGGGWFMWAFRDAMVDAGFYQSLPQALTAYQAIAREVNDACNRGLLHCVKKPDSFLPPMNAAYGLNFLRFTGNLCYQMTTFYNLHFFYSEVAEPTDQYQQFQEITLEHPHSVDVQGVRIHIMEWIVKIYKIFFLPCILFGLVRLFFIIKNHENQEMPQLYVLLCLCISIAILASIIVTLASISLPIAIFSGYFGPMIPLLFMVLISLFVLRSSKNEK